jgi:hypothetical protein
MGCIVNYIYNKIIVKNENFIGVFIGGVGSGKSYCGISLGQEYQKKYPKAKIWIIFQYNELLDLLIRGKKNQIKKGDVVIYEEMGISADHRAFWSLPNKIIKQITQIARNRNFAFLMNLPFLSLIDKDVKPLIHFVFETVHKDVKNRVVSAKCFKSSVNYRDGKTYFKYPSIFVNDEKKYYRIGRINFNHPEKVFTNSNMVDLADYEKQKDAFNDATYIQLQKEGEKLELKKTGKSRTSKIDTGKIVEEILQNPIPFITHKKNYDIINIDKIKFDCDLGLNNARHIKRVLEKKLKIGMNSNYRKEGGRLNLKI